MQIDIMGSALYKKQNIWQVSYPMDNNQLIIHCFPVDVFEWRIAEYGIRDLDILIHIVLYEPYLDPISYMPSTKEHLNRIIQVRGNDKLIDRNRYPHENISIHQVNDRHKKGKTKEEIDELILTSVKEDYQVHSEIHELTPLAMLKKHMRLDQDRIDVYAGQVALAKSSRLS